MDSEEGIRSPLAAKLIEKANLQQKVYDNAFHVFNQLKELLHEFSAELDEDLDERIDKRIRIEYRDRGKFEAQLQVAGEVLVFVMHTNVFSFERSHPVWQNGYIQADPNRAYCGVINIYNFLSDSFKYNRSGDEGYLIGRLFVNGEMQYFVEGKRQRGIRHERFGQGAIDEGALQQIVDSAVGYALDFDTLVPPYELVKVATLDQLNTKFESSKFEIGKRLGYEFRIDDI